VAWGHVCSRIGDARMNEFSGVVVFSWSLFSNYWCRKGLERPQAELPYFRTDWWR